MFHLYKNHSSWILPGPQPVKGTVVQLRLLVSRNPAPARSGALCISFGIFGVLGQYERGTWMMAYRRFLLRWPCSGTVVLAGKKSGAALWREWP